MEMVVLFRRRHTAMPRQGVATQWVTTSNAPFSDLNKSFQAFLKTFEIASKIFRKTGTNSGGFSVSRNGDCGNRLAAGEILRLRTACRGGCDKVWVSGSTKAFVKPFVKNLINGQK